MRKIFIITTIILFFSSCKKFVAINPPDTQVQAVAIFENDQAAISAIAGLYSQLISTNLTILNGGITLHTGLTSDEILHTAANTDLDGYRFNAISTTGNGTTRFWSPAYKYLYQTNAVLEGVAASKKLSDSIRTLLRGEALFVRAFVYFYLVNLFGDVPLVTTTDYRVNAIMARTPVSEIYLQIKNDLVEAKSLLKLTYPSPGRGRPNKYVVAALLARVYLYLDDWQNAEIESGFAISNTIYSLVPTATLGQAFRASTTEAIWQLIPGSTTINTAEGNVFVPSSATTIPGYIFTTYQLNAFEPGDKRKPAWIGSSSIGSPATIYYYPFKYQTRTTPLLTESYVVLRLAEQYLIRAEARAHLNNISGGQSDLNMIRNRAGLIATTASTQTALLDAIAHERQTELFCEWGHRWFDLKRTNKANQLLGAEKAPNWQPEDALFPVPQLELDRNPHLVQNPGY
jgi:hypothetical protein